MEKRFKNINEILDFAIENEQRAVDFYMELAQKASTKDMKEVFEQFAREEIKHKQRLMTIKLEGVITLPGEKVTDLKIADYAVPSDKPEDKMTYEDALILAMKREKAAFKLYTLLASRVSEPEIKSLFEALALEESRHKLRFEIEYDEYILREN